MTSNTGLRHLLRKIFDAIELMFSRVCTIVYHQFCQGSFYTQLETLKILETRDAGLRLSFYLEHASLVIAAGNSAELSTDTVSGNATSRLI